MKQLCPQCKKKEAKFSSTYPEMLVCYCGGDILKEVSAEYSDPILEEKFVYHVAHPKVKATIVGTLKNGMCKVLFQEDVSFSGNPTAKPSKKWVCQSKYLFDSEIEAINSHDPNLRR